MGAAAMAATGLSPATRAEKPSRKRIYMRPLGTRLPVRDLAMVASALRAFYAVDVVSLSRVALPTHAYYRPRDRYRAEKLLPVLEASRPSDGHRILGITAVDISTTKGKHPDWGILGLANISGSACVLSSFRCRRRVRSAHHATVRLGKVAVHEMGHTFGLSHCTVTKGCLMQDGRGSVLTIDEEHDLCRHCRMKLVQRGYDLNTTDPAPWV